MKNILNSVLSVKVLTNDKGDKIEQKQSRLIKKILNDNVIAELTDNDIVVKYDVKGKPVIVLNNGLMLGFDFIVKSLNTELYDTPE